MLIGDRLKYFRLVAVIAFATMLILQQSSILVGVGAAGADHYPRLSSSLTLGFLRFSKGHKLL